MARRPHTRHEAGVGLVADRPAALQEESRWTAAPDRAREPPSFRNVQLDRQILTEEEAATSRLLARVVQGVGREASPSLGGRRCLHLEVEAANLNRFGLVALRRLQQP